MKVAAIHFARKDINKPFLEELLELNIQAAKEGAKLIVNPELPLLPNTLLDDFSALNAIDPWQSIQEHVKTANHFIDTLKNKVANPYQCGVIYCFLEVCQQTGLIYNAAIWISPHGNNLILSRKQNVMTESAYCSPSLSPNNLVNWNGLVIGSLICADAFAPLICRSLILQGAELLAIPASLSKFGLIGLCSRAKENGIAILFANCDRSTSDAPPPEDTILSSFSPLLPYQTICQERYPDPYSLDREYACSIRCTPTHCREARQPISAIIDPQGNLLTGARGNQSKVLLADLDEETCRTFRAQRAEIRKNKSYLRVLTPWYRHQKRDGILQVMVASGPQLLAFLAKEPGNEECSLSGLLQTTLQEQSSLEHSRLIVLPGLPWLSGKQAFLSKIAQQYRINLATSHCAGDGWEQLLVTHTGSIHYFRSPHNHEKGSPLEDPVILLGGIQVSLLSETDVSIPECIAAKINRGTDLIIIPGEGAENPHCFYYDCALSRSISVAVAELHGEGGIFTNYRHAPPANPPPSPVASPKKGDCQNATIFCNMMLYPDTNPGEWPRRYPLELLKSLLMDPTSTKSNPPCAT